MEDAPGAWWVAGVRWKGPIFGGDTDCHSWWLDKISSRTSTEAPYRWDNDRLARAVEMQFSPVLWANMAHGEVVWRARIFQHERWASQLSLERTGDAVETIQAHLPASRLTTFKRLLWTVDMSYAILGKPWFYNFYHETIVCAFVYVLFVKMGVH